MYYISYVIVYYMALYYTILYYVTETSGSRVAKALSAQLKECEEKLQQHEAPLVRLVRTMHSTIYIYIYIQRERDIDICICTYVIL